MSKEPRTAGHRISHLFVAAGLCVSSLLGQPATTDDPGEKRPKPNYDAFLASSVPVVSEAGTQASVRATGRGAFVHFEERLGVPTFLWTAQAHPPVATATTKAEKGQRVEEIIARRHLAGQAEIYQLRAEDVDAARLASVHNTGRGAVVVKFRQEIGGVGVFREEVNVVMKQNLELIGITGYLSRIKVVPAFTLPAEEAVARSLADTLDGEFARTEVMRAGGDSGYELYLLTPEAEAARRIRLVTRSRAKRVIYRLPDKVLPGYYIENAVEVEADSRTLTYAYVISAADGKILFRKNLTAHAEATARRVNPYSYRVWASNDPALRLPFDGPQGTSATPHPTGTPDGYRPEFVAPNLITVSSGPIASGDPWLPPGQTKTSGNNVEAYADLAAPDGFRAGTGDTYAFTNGSRSFDRVYNTALDPQASRDQTHAAVTQLFYTLNFLHDWFYGAGFDEASGNAQANNYGRGGIQHDSILAETQNYDGRNGADMSTPADGGSPRMQMYLFDGAGSQSLTVNSPSRIAGQYAVGNADFGPRSFRASGPLVLVNDGVARGTVSDGCEAPFVNAAAVRGNIAMIDRGVCSYALKVKHAQSAGAAGVLLVNSTRGILNMSGTDRTVTIGVLSVSSTDGKLIRDQLAKNTVNVSLVREAGVDRDGSLDNQIVAHEWGHYISNRLIGDAVGLGTNQAQGLGEGWADFHSLLLSVNAGDMASPANTNFEGVYAMGGYALGGGGTAEASNNSYYFGSRRVPYSTDMSKNPLTFRHIADGEPLPDSPLVRLNGLPNSEMHNTGEVWATLLWECYAALLRDTLPPTRRLTFEQAQARMLDYLVAAYKITPVNPTLLEARDALLAAAGANDLKDYALFWEAFAKRGAGTGAVAPDRYSYDNSPAVESFVAGTALTFVGASLVDDVSTCDSDGLLDGGETGRLYITLRNETSQGLSRTTAVITVANPTVIFPDGNKIKFPVIGPREAVTASTRVKLKAGTSGLQKLDFTVALDDPLLGLSRPLETHYQTYANADVSRNSTSADDVESPVSAWNSLTIAGTDSWHRTVLSGPLNNAWDGPDADAVSDTALVSPVLQVGSKPFSLKFRHRYSFESHLSENYDGGVIEISANGGATWTDIGSGYTGTIVQGTGNPLAARRAYTGTSSAYPDFTTTTINLGTRFANKSVRIRFRIGTDGGVGGLGWIVDDLVFSGLTNSPFSSLVPHKGCSR